MSIRLRWVFSFSLLVAASYHGVAYGQGEPDALLTIPHILRTPQISSFKIAPSGESVGLNISVLGKEAIWMVSIHSGGSSSAGAPIATEKGWGERDLDWSPDGRAIAFVSKREGTSEWHLYVSDPDGGNARRLTDHRREERSPRWSPDGTQLAFLARDGEADTGWDLWLISRSGGEARQLTREPFDEEEPEWSPDGKRVTLSMNRGHHQDGTIGIVSVTDGSVEPLLADSWTGDCHSARWSPDGTRIAFVSDQPGLASIFTVTVTGTVAVAATASGRSPGERQPERLVASEFEQSSPEWSPDGRRLAYLENRDGDVKVRVHEIETKQDRSLTLRNGVHSSPAWYPDGTAVASLFEAWNYPRDVWSYPIEGGRTRLSDTLPPDLDVRKMIRPELIRFRSFDEREITGYLYVPESASAANPASLIVHPHGGPTSQWQNKWYPFVQLLVQKGYAVFAPNVRGSSGYGVEFEKLNDGAWGQGDLEDLIAGTKFVAARPEIRDDRIGIWGVSYGGFLTLAAIGRYPEFFACAVEAVGMPDLEALYRRTNEEGQSYLEREIGPLRGHLQLYRDLSPIRDVSSVQTPLLTFHGEIYPLVPYSTKEPYLAELRKRPTFPLLDFVFKGEEVRATYRHDLHPEAAWAYVEKILEFLEVYL